MKLAHLPHSDMKPRQMLTNCSDCRHRILQIRIPREICFRQSHFSVEFVKGTGSQVEVMLLPGTVKLCKVSRCCELRDKVLETYRSVLGCFRFLGTLSYGHIWSHRTTETGPWVGVNSQRWLQGMILLSKTHCLELPVILTEILCTVGTPRSSR